MTDLRDLVDEDYTFGEAKMYNAAKPIISIFVEAKEDELFYKKHFNPACVFFGYNGWQGVVEAIKESNKDNTILAIGIIDADFKRVLKKVPIIDNLFLTDHHDLEMMLVDSETWEAVIAHFSMTKRLHEFEKKHKQTIKSYLLKIAKEIAWLRLLNEQEGLGLVFKTGKNGNYKYLTYSKFIDVKTLVLDKKKLLQTVENKSNKPNLLTTQSNQLKLLAEKHKEISLLELCNGHEVLNLLSISLEQAISNKKSGGKVSAEQLATHMSIAYTNKIFKTTALHSSLSGWERTNLKTPYKLLK